MKDIDNIQEYLSDVTLSSFLILLCGLLALVSIVAYIISFKASSSYFEVMNTIGVLASISLSAILAYLYYKMSEIQKDQRDGSERRADLQETLTNLQDAQNDILERQQELIELDYEPKVQVEGYELTGNKIQLQLRNLGRGLAEHIAIRPTIDIRNNGARYSTSHCGSDSSMYTSGEIIWRDDETNDEYVPSITTANRPNEQELLSKNRRGGILSPEEGSVIFEARVRFAAGNKDRRGNISKREILPDTFFDYLTNNNMSNIFFNIDLLYTNEVEDLNIIHIMGTSGDIQGGMNLEDISELSGRNSGSRHHILNRVKKIDTYPPKIV